MIAHIYSCPSCTAVLNFQNAATNYIVCNQCSAGWQRWEDGALTLKSGIPQPQDTISPIRIGTTGTWKDKRFTVTGRIRCLFEDGFANNWTIHVEDGSMRTLVECYGQYAIYEKIQLEKDVKFSRVNNLSFNGGQVELNNGKHYVLERRNKCREIEVEGEVWMFDWDGKFSSLEVAAAGGDRLELIDPNSNYFLYFRIHYVPFDDFGFQQLRPQTLGAVSRSINCTQCSKPITLKSFPWSQSCICVHCGAAHSYTDDKIKFIRRFKQDKVPGIPLYSKGKLKGVQYELIGFSVKADAHGWNWREYCLFNPLYGYAFLSEYDGHWIFLKEEAVAPVGDDKMKQGFLARKVHYRLYNEYTFSVEDGYGEFPGNAFTEKGAHCREYIAPPQMWAREQTAQGLTWFHGEHISSNELHDAFGDNISLPYKVGTGAVQPSMGFASIQWLGKAMAYVGLGFLLLFAITTIFNRKEVVYNNTVYLYDTVSTHTTVTPKFRLDKYRSNLEMELTAAVNNNWLEANISLVNADNGKEYTLEEGVEYYSGISEGESWSEGNTSADALLNTIPGGNYFMEITVSKDYGATVNYYSLKATYDVPIWRNLILFLLIALVPGVVLWIYVYYRERLRWQNSPFSPYTISDQNE